MQYLLLLLSIIMNASGYLSFKHISRRPMNFQWFLFFSIGLLLGAVGTFAFTKALKTLKLSTAYPIFAGGTYLLVLVISTLFFSERLSTLNVLGAVLILAGIYCITAQ